MFSIGVYNKYNTNTKHLHTTSTTYATTGRCIKTHQHHTYIEQKSAHPILAVCPVNRHLILLIHRCIVKLKWRLDMTLTIWLVCGFSKPPNVIVEIIYTCVRFVLATISTRYRLGVLRFLAVSCGVLIV